MASSDGRFVESFIQYRGDFMTEVHILSALVSSVNHPNLRLNLDLYHAQALAVYVWRKLTGTMLTPFIIFGSMIEKTD